MSKYVAKAAVRQAKNLAMGFTDVQTKVREATSNDPWGPSGTQMTELADATFRAHEFMEIMDMLDKRLNDSGKNWRHVFKALTLLDYMIHCGSEQVIAYAKQNLYVIKTLKEFQYIDEEGKDQGANVREKSKAIASLLADDERLKEERRARASLRDRMGTTSMASDPAYSGQQQRTAEVRKSYQPNTAYEEEHQLERAIEESKRTAEEHERRMRARAQLDRQDSQAGGFQSASQPAKQPQPEQQVDLWGGNIDQKKTDFDFFASMAVPTAVNPISQPDPFGFAPPSSQQQQNLFGGGPSNPFGQQPQQQQLTYGGAASSMSFASSSMSGANAFQQPQQQMQVYQQPAQQQQLAFPPSFPAGASQQQQFGATSSFDAAFDTGAGQKNLVPRGMSDPNAQMAQIARNAVQIDPFASMAAQGSAAAGGSGAGKFGSTHDLFGGQPTMSSGGQFGGPNYNVNTSSMFGGSQQQQQQQSNPFGGQQSSQQQQRGQQQLGGNDPFAALVPFAAKSAAPQQPQHSVGIAGQTPMNFSGGNKQGSLMGAGPMQGSMGGGAMFGGGSSAPGFNQFGGGSGMGGGFTQAPAGQPPQQQPNNNFFF